MVCGLDIRRAGCCFEQTLNGVMRMIILNEGLESQLEWTLTRMATTRLQSPPSTASRVKNVPSASSSAIACVYQ